MDIVQDYSFINSGLRKINTDTDEFGPYLVEQGERYDSSATYPYYPSHIILCSSGVDGSQDIWYTHNLEKREYAQARKVAFLNSDYNDCYPTLNTDQSRIYFCSDKEDNFDMYSCEIDPSRTMLQVLGDSASRAIQREEGLSSDAEDKCPYIAGSLMVFSSNREGGYGGFDLYYSTYNGQSWGKAINFGETINGPCDEYRPIVLPHEDFVNDFMLFSSNRPGGIGGFDLYYVGIDKR
jgi:Tol biopolymer transport system component